MKASLSLILALAVTSSIPVSFAQTPDTRIAVKTADDLPRHTYKIDGKASEFLLTDKPFQELLTKLKRDSEDDLAKYRITDPTTLQSYYAILQQIAMLQGRYEDAISYIAKIKSLETKESVKLITGQILRAAITARKTGTDPQAVTAEFKRTLNTNISALPWNKIREEIIAAKGRAEITSKAYLVGSIQGELDPIVEQSKGELSGDLARDLVSVRFIIDVVLPLNPSIVDVYSTIIARSKVAQNDIWTGHLISLTDADKGTPVVVSIWDSGVDTSLFGTQVWTNSNEVLNGKDDDGNGYIDDIHGIAFDLESNPVTELLLPVTELKSDKTVVATNMKGFMDIRANIDSPEGSAVKKRIASLKPEQITGFFEDLNLFGNHIHGTHVAGIAQDGNPFIRMLPIRITFDFHEIPTLTPTVERSQKDAKAVTDAVLYMKRAGVRVVNMSWGGSRQAIEADLEKKGVGKDAQERAAVARTLFKIERDALDNAIHSAPDILFVAAAGNENNDNEFAEAIPSGLHQPNLITIGAVDKSGKPTSFTTFGKSVKLYANGFEVDSTIPGGQHLKLSGTSMSAPNVVNLAAKLIALNPKLTTAEVIDLISKGADPMQGYKGLYVINPKKSVGLINH